MLLGIPSYLSDQYNRGYFYFRQKELGLYFNDTFKVTHRLTIDYGLRWDAWTPYNEKYDRLVNLDIKNYPGMMVITPHNTTMESIPGIPPAVLESWKLRGLTWETADQAHFPGALVPPNWKDFGPRFSVAYKLSDKWVIRGGFGMYYWPMPLAQILASSRTNPPLNLRFQTDYSNLNGPDPMTISAKP
jgi:TonB dependent receptor